MEPEEILEKLGLQEVGAVGAADEAKPEKGEDVAPLVDSVESAGEDTPLSS